MKKQRRDFLKLSTAGAAGLVLIRGGRADAAWPSSGKLEINPNISNMRVVACTDAKMLKSTPASMTFAAENAAVDTARVHANMDAMAMQLAQVATPDEAWKAIFRSSKPWASTLVAIKINTVEVKNMARLAVIEKFCRVMIGFGVPASNIIVFDGNSQYSAGLSNYTSAFSTTDATKIPGVVSKVNDALGGTTNAKLADGSSASCTADIANGKVDILINIANNKGHTLHGGSTLCMKNHFGTFAPNHNNLAAYVLNTNKSDAIIGGDPVRQQLCFVDSLIANKAENSGTPEAMPYYLIMGTFGPAVDYLTVKKVREAVMNATHDATTVNNFITSFGYTTSDPQWILVPPATTTPDAGVGGTGGTGGTGGSGGGTGGSSGGNRDAGSDGVRGTGGVNAGGSSGTGGAGGGGSSGTGGIASGGSSGTAGTGSGGARASGGVGGGGSVGTGGKGGSGGSSSSTASGGAGGTVSSGGTTSPGGSMASGGSGGGGNVGNGGSGGASSSAGSGGSVPSGGSTGAQPNDPNLGCGCRVGGGRGVGGFSVALAFGALLAGQLRRLLVRREDLAKPRPPAEAAEVASDESASDT